MTDKMDPYWKTEWLRELRSGKWKQAKSNLRVVDKDGTYSYCCLGVLQNITGAPFPRSDHGEMTATACKLTGVSNLGDFPCGPINISVKEEIVTVNGKLISDDMEMKISALYELNDDLGWNFNQIADFIEEHF